MSPILAINKFSLPASCNLCFQYWMLSELCIQKLITVSTARSTSQPRLGETVSTDSTNASRVHLWFPKYSTPAGCCCNNSCCWLKKDKVGDIPKSSNVYFTPSSRSIISLQGRSYLWLKIFRLMPISRRCLSFPDLFALDSID